jgi:hypothetical protein
MIRYTYCYNSHRDPQRNHIPSMDGYLAGDELTTAWEGEIEGSLTSETCDELFHLFNAPGARPERYCGPSMSMGDVVILSQNNVQVAFACERVGWRRINPAVIGHSVVKPRPAEWERSDAQLEEYRRALAQEGF